MSSLKQKSKSRWGAAWQRIWDGVLGSRHQPAVRKPRRLMLDQLEERQLLSVTVSSVDELIDQSTRSDQYALSSKSVAMDNDGDFVVAWTRYDTVQDIFGNSQIDANIYARYYTESVQRITLSEDAKYFTLAYNGNEVQSLTISRGTKPFTDKYDSENYVAGTFDLSFHDDLTDTTLTCRIEYDEYMSIRYNAYLIQDALRGLGIAALSDVEVEAVDSYSYTIKYGDNWDSENCELSVANISLSGYLPAVELTTTREPGMTIAIPVSSNAVTTATNIMYALNYKKEYLYLAPTEFSQTTFASFGDPESATTSLGVTVTARSATEFDITFSGYSQQPKLVVTEYAGRSDAQAGINATGTSTGTILKQSTDEFRVNDMEVESDETLALDCLNQYDAQVAIDADGDFVITWTSETTSMTGGTDVFAKRFSAAGWVADDADVEYWADMDADGYFAETPIRGVRAYGSEFLVNTYRTNDQGTSSVAMSDDGAFVIAWGSTGQDLSFFNCISGQLFDRDGNRVGSEFDVTTENTTKNFDCYAAMSADGVFGVVWTNTNDPNYYYGDDTDADYYVPNAVAGAIQARVYDADGSTLLSEFNAGGGGGGTIAFDTGDNFVIAWDVLADTDNVDDGVNGTTSGGVRAQRYQLYDAAGEVSGAVTETTFRVNSASANPSSTAYWPFSQGAAQAILDADGDMTVVYTGYAPDVSQLDIDVQVLLMDAISNSLSFYGQSVTINSSRPGYFRLTLDGMKTTEIYFDPNDLDQTAAEIQTALDAIEEGTTVAYDAAAGAFVVAFVEAKNATERPLIEVEVISTSETKSQQLLTFTLGDPSTSSEFTLTLDGVESANIILDPSDLAQATTDIQAALATIASGTTVVYDSNASDPTNGVFIFRVTFAELNASRTLIVTPATNVTGFVADTTGEVTDTYVDQTLTFTLNDAAETTSFKLTLRGVTTAAITVDPAADFNQSAQAMAQAIQAALAEIEFGTTVIVKSFDVDAKTVVFTVTFTTAATEAERPVITSPEETDDRTNIESFAAENGAKGSAFESQKLTFTLTDATSNATFALVLRGTLSTVITLDPANPDRAAADIQAALSAIEQTAVGANPSAVTVAFDSASSVATGEFIFTVTFSAAATVAQRPAIDCPKAINLKAYDATFAGTVSFTSLTPNAIDLYTIQNLTFDLTDPAAVATFSLVLHDEATPLITFDPADPNQAAADIAAGLWFIEAGNVVYDAASSDPGIGRFVFKVTFATPATDTQRPAIAVYTLGRTNLTDFTADLITTDKYGGQTLGFTLTDPLAAGSFTLTLDGVTTTAITLNPADPGQAAADIEAALSAIEAGTVVAYDAASSDPTTGLFVFKVTFATDANETDRPLIDAPAVDAINLGNFTAVLDDLEVLNGGLGELFRLELGDGTYTDAIEFNASDPVQVAAHMQAELQKRDPNATVVYDAAASNPAIDNFVFRFTYADGAVQVKAISGISVESEFTYASGEARADLEAYYGLLRGDAWAIMYSQFDADPTQATTIGGQSDCVVNNTRDGSNTTILLDLDPLAVTGSFTLRITLGDHYQDVAITPVFLPDNGGINAADTVDAIDAALEAMSLTGVNWPEAEFEGPIFVSLVDAAARTGTAWDAEANGINISNLVYEITFQGEVHDLAFLASLQENALKRVDDVPADAPNVVTEVYGNSGTYQYSPSIAMDADGSYVMVWTQYVNGAINFYYRTFTENTCTAGATVTDVVLDSGERLDENETVTDAVNSVVVTFDEAMTVSGVHGVTNVNNWVILCNGSIVTDAIAAIYYGVNEAATRLGLDASNKYEAVIVLNSTLASGEYQIVAKSSIWDAAGNVLYYTGYNTNGDDFVRSFDVVVSTSDDMLVNTTTTGDQYTSPNGQTTASDAEGDYVVVWTSAAPGAAGIYAKLYDVTWTTDSEGNRTSSYAVGSEILVTSNTTARYASVACDASGNFVVTWSQADAGNWNIYARRYDADGNALGSQFLVNTTTINIQKYSTVAMDDDGDFVITWQSLNQDGGGYGIYAQRFDPAGLKIGGTNEMQVLSFVNSPLGTFALSWNGNTTADIAYAGNTSSIVGAVQSALRAIGANVEVAALSGTTIAIEFVGEAGSQDQSQITLAHAMITGEAGAGITVATRVEGDDGEILVNTTTENNQVFPAIAMDSDGSFIISWTSYGQDGDTAYESNIYAKTFVSNHSLRTTETNSVAKETRTTSTIRANDGNNYTVEYATTMTTAGDPDDYVVANGIYEGVVMLLLHRTDGEGVASGVLMSDGFHILTAAHTVCDDLGNMVATSVDIVFYLADGTTQTITSASIYVHPDYNGDATEGGDLAVLTLSEAAPDGVEGYEIASTSAYGEVFTRVGFGRSGTGETGSTLETGTKRSGDNQYDASASLLGYASDGLLYDFDNGLAANDVLGVLFGINDLGLGLDEVCAAPGDSGGPNIVDGVVVGITSYGVTVYGEWDVTEGVLDSSFGEMGVDVDVSLYADWINSVMIGGGSEFLVNQTTDGDQSHSSVAMDADGDFVVTWTSYGQDGSDPTSDTAGANGIYARRYDSGAAAFSGEFLVNSYTDDNQQYSHVTMDADGDFIVVWESFSHDTSSSYGVYAQRYVRNDLVGTGNSYGVNGELGSEILINSTKAGNQRYPGVAMDDTGDFIVVWSGSGPGDTQGVFMKTFNQVDDTAGARVIATYTTVGATMTLQELGEDDTRDATVAKAVVTFTENMCVTGGTSGKHSVTNVNNWTLTRNGVALTSGIASVTFSYNTTTNRYEAVVTFDSSTSTIGSQALASGTYVLTLRQNVWDAFGNALDGNSDGTPGGAFSRTFVIDIEGDSSSNIPGPGTPDGDDEDDSVNTTETGDQSGVVVASDPDGNYVVVWVSYGQGTDGADDGNIVAQRYDYLGVAIGSEFTVNTYTVGDQTEVDVAMDSFGNFVIVWSGEGATDVSGIYARVYDTYGKAITSQFLVNKYIVSTQNQPSVAMDADGNFVVSWTCAGRDGSSMGVYARTFNLQGQATTSDFLVNTTTVNSQNHSDVAMDDNGDFAVVWQSYGQDGVSWGIYGQRFTASAAKNGGEFQVNSYTTNKQTLPSVAMDADGDFVVTWSSFGQDGSGYGIYARRFTSAGVAGSEFQVNNGITMNYQVTPDVSMSSDGAFVITWSSYGASQSAGTITTDYDYGIYARIFNADGSDFTTSSGTTLREFRVNAIVTDDQITPAVAVSDNAELVIAWVGPDADGDGIYTRLVGLASGNSDDLTAIAAGSTVAVYDPTTGTFYLRYSNTTGTANSAFVFGPANSGWIALVGDWNGDGVETVGLYDPAGSKFYLRNNNSTGYAEVAFAYGAGGAGWTPLVGDWDGDGVDTVGLYDSTSGKFYFRNANSTGYADVAFTYGMPGWTPIVGDWNGDGADTIGLYCENTSMFFLRNTNSTGYADTAFMFGPANAGWTPVVSDANNDGVDTIGLYDVSSSKFYLKNSNATGYADAAFVFGTPGASLKAMTGTWVKGSAVRADQAIADSGANALTQDELDSTVATAISNWAKAGLDADDLARLSAVQFNIDNLSGAYLGMTYDNVIVIDTNAAGNGWFVDSTPEADEEYVVTASGSLEAVSGNAVDRIDLLSVVEHELGHVLGLDDADALAETLMSETLDVGVRRSVYNDAVDLVLASND